jgi:hypothetical protein
LLPANGVNQRPPPSRPKQSRSTPPRLPRSTPVAVQFGKTDAQQHIHTCGTSPARCCCLRPPRRPYPASPSSGRVIVMPRCSRRSPSTQWWDLSVDLQTSSPTGSRTGDRPVDSVAQSTDPRSFAHRSHRRHIDRSVSNQGLLRPFQ